MIRLSKNLSGTPRMLVLYLTFCILVIMSLYGLYKTGQNIIIYNTYDKYEEIITACDEKLFRVSQKPRDNRKKSKFAPVVVSDYGDKIIGHVYFKKETCEAMINEPITVMINPSNSSDGYLLSFVQFWIVPLIVFFAPLFFLFFLTKILFIKS